jgi:hypothetical protein
LTFASALPASALWKKGTFCFSTKKEPFCTSVRKGEKGDILLFHKKGAVLHFRKEKQNVPFFLSCSDTG